MELVRLSQCGRIGGRASGGGDSTAPTLSSASAGTPTSDGATGFGVTTNEGNGTLYWAVVTNGGSCTDAQLKAGAGGNIVAGKAGNQAVTTTGAQAISTITGLTSSTTYQIKYLQRDAAGNDSSQASVSLTTSAAAFATWNPADKSASLTLSGGNLTVTYTAAGSGWNSARATIGKAAGKWYWEVAITAQTAATDVGVGNSSATLSSYVGSDANGWGYVGSTGQKANSGSLAAYGASFGAGATIMVALDMDNGKVWFGKNGTWQASGDPAAGTNAAYTGLTGTIYPMMGQFTQNDVATTNFGASAFTYTPPTGFSGVS